MPTSKPVRVLLPAVLWTVTVVFSGGSSIPADAASKPDWLRDLDSPDAGLRVAAGYRWSRLPEDPGERLELLRRVLADDDRMARRGAVAALGELDVDPGVAVPLLVAALGDSEPLVAAHAAVALGKVGVPAVPALLAALDDDAPVGELAASSLVLIGAPAEPLLASKLERRRGAEVSTAPVEAVLAVLGAIEDGATVGLASPLEEGEPERADPGPEERQGDETAEERLLALAAADPELLPEVFDAFPREGPFYDPRLYRALAAVDPRRVTPELRVRIAAEAERLLDLGRGGEVERRQVLERFVELGPWAGAAVSEIPTYFIDPDPAVRLAAIDVLEAAQLGWPFFARHLRPLLWDPDPELRERAFRTLADPPPLDHPDTADVAVVTDRVVLDVVSAIAARLAAVRRSGVASPVRSAEPAVGGPGWPPPPHSGWHVLPRQLHADEGATLGDLHRRLTEVLEDAGYRGSRLFAVPGGFALVTPIERIDESGAPHPARWLPARPPLRRFELVEQLAQLFLAPPGDFRVVALVVTSRIDLSGGGEDTLPDLTPGGGRQLPPELATQEVGDHYLHALVYHYEKEPGRRSLRRPSPIPVTEHLRRAGILEGLESGR